MKQETVYVYMMTFPNGKRYVGISKDYKKRWKKHKNGNKIVGNAVRKYKSENVIYKVMCICEGYNYAGVIEKGLIKALKARIYQNGYNLTEGGEGSNGYKFTEEQKKTLSDAHKMLLPEKEICDEYLNGISCRKLGEKYNVNEETIRCLLIRNKVRRRKRNTQRIFLPEKEVVTKYNEGDSMVTLTKFYDVSQAVIRNILTSNNIKIRTSAESNTKNLPRHEICEQYISGNSPKILMKLYNVSEGTIKSVLERNGITLRNSKEAQRLRRCR